MEGSLPGAGRADMEREVIVISTLEKAVEWADLVFSRGLEVPEPNPDKQRRLEALNAANLVNQARALEAEIRRERATELGFAQMSPMAFVGLLMGEAADREVRRSGESMFLEYNRESPTGAYLITPRDFIRDRPAQFLGWLIGWPKSPAWTVRMGALDYLSLPIPYGVVLRLQELKQLRLFDHFVAMAPLEVWRTAEETRAIDPLVLAVIGNGTAADRHYLVARW